MISVKVLEHVINMFHQGVDHGAIELFCKQQYDEAAENPEETTRKIISHIAHSIPPTPYVKALKAEALNTLKAMQAGGFIALHWPEANAADVAAAALKYHSFQEWDKACGMCHAESFIMQGWNKIACHDWMNTYRHQVEYGWIATLRSRSVSIDWGKGGTPTILSLDAPPSFKGNATTWQEREIRAIVERMPRISRKGS